MLQPVSERQHWRVKKHFSYSIWNVAYKLCFVTLAKLCCVVTIHEIEQSTSLWHQPGKTTFLSLCKVYRKHGILYGTLHLRIAVEHSTLPRVQNSQHTISPVFRNLLDICDQPSIVIHPAPPIKSAAVCETICVRKFIRVTSVNYRGKAGLVINLFFINPNDSFRGYSLIRNSTTHQQTYCTAGPLVHKGFLTRMYIVQQ